MNGIPNITAFNSLKIPQITKYNEIFWYITKEYILDIILGTNNKEQLDKSVEEARNIANEIAKKNPIDAKYFFESFKSNIGESPASQESVEIQYSSSDKARAEKIRLLFNPQTQEDFSRIMRDVYQQTGYKISPKTIYEYQQEYGKLK